MAQMCMCEAGVITAIDTLDEHEYIFSDYDDTCHVAHIRKLIKCMYAAQHLLDRIAVTLSADVPATFDQRVQAVTTAARFQVS